MDLVVTELNLNITPQGKNRLKETLLAKDTSLAEYSIETGVKFHHDQFTGDWQLYLPPMTTELWEPLLALITPCLRENSSIEFSTPEGSLVRYLFNNGEYTVTTKDAQEKDGEESKFSRLSGLVETDLIDTEAVVQSGFSKFMGHFFRGFRE